MRVIAGNFKEITDEDLQFVQQLGLSGVQINTPPLNGIGNFGSNGLIGSTFWVRGDEPPAKKWDYLELLQLRVRIENYGLKLEAIENVPIWFYDKIMLGLEGRDEQIEYYQHTIQAVGKAGIPILGYCWMPTRVWRTNKSLKIRGDAITTSFDADIVDGDYIMFDRRYTEEEMWKNYEYFIKAVLPVAEEFGVKLALHPDDPPVPSLGGIPRIFRNLKGFVRAMELGKSDYHGLDFCIGTWTEGGVDSMMDSLRRFTSEGKVFYVHFRNILGQLPSFQECFIDEGQADLIAVLKILKDSNFDGFLMDDHVPIMVNDTRWGHRGRAYSIGYIKGLIRALNELY
jgi:mannonate dehydratase